MATGFGVDTDAAARLAQELAKVRDSLSASFVDQYDSPTGSARVEEALHRFFRDSSDSRVAMEKLLDRAAGLLRGLAEGTAALDTALADALPTVSATPVVLMPAAPSGPAGTR